MPQLLLQGWVQWDRSRVVDLLVSALKRRLRRGATGTRDKVADPRSVWQTELRKQGLDGPEWYRVPRLRLRELSHHGMLPQSAFALDFQACVRLFDAAVWDPALVLLVQQRST